MIGQSLEKIVEAAIHLKQVQKGNLQYGDLVIVITRNSTYSIRVLDDDLFQISGGWFDQKGLSPMITTIRGCTWGGAVIKVDIIAACGLCLEFGNRVVTTTVQKVYVIPSGCQN